jgi:D-alanyl-D-alanine carboxypeptidase
MEPLTLSRRAFLVRAGALAATPLLAPGSASPAPTEGASEAVGSFAVTGEPVAAALDAFIPVYMKAMNSPGLTLGYVDDAGHGKSACYGFSNLDSKQPVTPELLFQIGSISKSFLAIILLQLREEGRLDFERPVLEYMPWLAVETPYGPITLHHMLTHTTGLPGDGDLFPSNPTDRARQSWKPGERFHYSNLCYQAMGKLVGVLDGRTYGESVQKRILDPLGMTATSPYLTELIRSRTAESYTPEQRDRPFPRQGKLASAPKIISDSSAGSIASTPDDMRKYMRMLLNRGKHEQHRILSEESFALFSHPHIKAEEFGPTASYGYGIAVDALDGHTILPHTGGMVSFVSAMHLDMDGGYGAFASINAQLGYRPNPVAEYAIQCMRAKAESKPLPKQPEIVDPSIVKSPKEYEGKYQGPDGKVCQVVADEHSIRLELDGRIISLECAGGDRFLSNLPEYSKFAFVFHREEAKPADSADASKPAQALPILEMTHGSRWFARNPPASLKPAPERFSAFTGMYNNDSPWSGTFRVVERKGQLWIEGEVPLIEIGDALFRTADEPDSPETIAFFHLVNGRAQLAKLGGTDFWRITTECV